MCDMVHLHVHSMLSNPYSGLEVDSTTPFQAYIERAKDDGMSAIAFTEHGSILHHVAKKQMCEKYNIKYIHGEEFYVTENIDTDKLVRDNYHCCLYAKNQQGVEELNQLSSLSFNRNDGHFYYQPRITLSELENTSDNILVLTACVAGILCKGTDTAKKRFLKFLLKNKHRCWLEIQPHDFEKQKKYNTMLYNLSNKTGLRLIATNDVHSIVTQHAEGRKIMQRAKNVEFHDEDECDLTWKTYDGMIEAFCKQSVLSVQAYTSAIQETVNFANAVEEYKLDYSNKYPRFKNSKQEFKKRIVTGVKERGIDKLPNYKTEYIPRITEELKTYEHNDAIDFMLLDADYKNWLRENNINYGVSRGSVSGSLIAYLLHNTDVDSVKYKLNFSRFMNTERVSLADVDTDIYAEDRYKVREYLFGRDDLSCCNIVTFNTIKMRGAIKDVGRALGLSPNETQSISDNVVTDEKGVDSIPDEVRERYPELFRYVDIVIGTITSLGRHAAGIVCSPINVEKAFGTLSISSDPRPVSQIDMHEIDSLNFVKLDLLGLNAVGLIDKACKLANIDYLTPDKIDFTDENVIGSISKDTTLIFQFESGFASESLRKTLSDNTLSNIKAQNKDISYLDIMAMVSGAIRPAGESYRESLFEGVYKDNKNKALNDFLKPTLGYLVYQEQIIDFLHDFCGFTMGQADIVRRHFAKKTGTEKDIPIIENGGYMVDVHGNQDNRYIKGFVSIAQEKYNMTEEEARNTIKDFLIIIEDASNYLFSRNHAIPYSMIGYFIGWLRYYYKIELLTAALNIYKDNSEKMSNIKEYIKKQGIKIEGVRFGKSRAEYFMDKNENTIYQGIESIKYCNATIAEELYELSQYKQYVNFIDLLFDITEKTSVDTRQIEILTVLNFFSDYGKNKKILDLIRFYEKIKKRSILKKAEIENMDMLSFGIYDTFEKENIIRKYAEKETAKQYSQIDKRSMLIELFENMDDSALPIKEQITYEKEYIDNIVYTNKKAPVGMYYVLQLKTYENKAKPYLQLYNIKRGTMINTRIISENGFIETPFNEGSIIMAEKIGKRYKKKKDNNTGRWYESNEQETILKKWSVCR